MVVVAGGSGTRAGLAGPKQMHRWRGRPLVVQAVARAKAAGIVRIVVVARADLTDATRQLLSADVKVVAGGGTRQQSVRAGLEALANDPPAAVLIHDAARPDLSSAVVERLIAALAEAPGAIPVLPVADSLVRNGAVVLRDGLFRVQTPQAFRFPAILDAHRSWRGPATAGDDAEVARAAGLTVQQVEGDERLKKLTYEADFAERIPVRVGTGYDVHRLAEGEELWLGGIKIAHPRGLAGHSDADVAIHALVDAMLGAVAAGDIGEHFPPSDPQWKGAASDRFLTHAAALVEAAGYRVGNLDLTIICEAPKIGPHREAIRMRLAQLLALDIAQVSVKATTTERLGFTGRQEGIAAQAVVTVVPLG